MMIFWWEGKQEYPKKHLSERSSEPTDTTSPEIDPRPHWWKATARTTASTLLPLVNFSGDELLRTESEFSVLGWLPP